MLKSQRNYLCNNTFRKSENFFWSKNSIRNYVTQQYFSFYVGRIHLCFYFCFEVTSFRKPAELYANLVEVTQTVTSISSYFFLSFTRNYFGSENVDLNVDNNFIGLIHEVHVFNSVRSLGNLFCHV